VNTKSRQAGGTNIGHWIVRALLSHPDSFNTTIVARASSTSTFPAGAKVLYVPDALQHSDLVFALQGQDARKSSVDLQNWCASCLLSQIRLTIETSI